ncbi:hypothetical protein FIBSPDRAFT_900645 [Athelia psychrophila]|uniref:RRM domain-containing protein n=1 Tax=Athelia psychrophila TaxID=1759441 RepID=A0A165Y784_9AGAM|nr:hypothetical protein FIBSPDRAFT_900645 [Fibularhizoctonia sp. CBS 109695]
MAISRIIRLHALSSGTTESSAYSASFDWKPLTLPPVSMVKWKRGSDLILVPPPTSGLSYYQSTLNTDAPPVWRLRNACQLLPFMQLLLAACIRNLILRTAVTDSDALHQRLPYLTTPHSARLQFLGLRVAVTCFGALHQLFRCWPPHCDARTLKTRAPAVRPVSAVHKISLRRQRERENGKIKAKEALRLATKKRDYHYVYVGNILSATTEAMLRHQFKSCSAIKKITIRCSAGVPLTGEASVHIGRKGLFYATVVFERIQSISKALKLDGAVLGEYPLKVCLSPGDLPDLELLVTQRIQRLLERRGTIYPTRLPGSMPDPTERVIASDQVRQQRAFDTPLIQTPEMHKIVHAGWPVIYIAIERQEYDEVAAKAPPTTPASLWDQAAGSGELTLGAGNSHCAEAEI